MKHMTILAVICGILLGVAAVMSPMIFRRGFSSAHDAMSGKTVSRPRELTKEEQRALVAPAKDAPDADKKQHFLLVQSLAKKSDTLDMSGCVGNPIALATIKGEKLFIANNDSANHTLQLDPMRQYVVPAKSRKEIKIDFPFDTGVYGYGCDNSLTAAGFFLVEP